MDNQAQSLHLLSACTNVKEVIICGDLNLPGVNWNSDGSFQTNEVSSPASVLSVMFSYLQWRQCKYNIISHGQILDLVFSTIDLEVKKADEELFPIEGYHPALLFMVNFDKHHDTYEC